MTFQEKIANLVESGFQVIYVATAERGRCEAELHKAAIDLEMDYITWDGISGFSSDGSCKDPIEALETMDDGKNTVWRDKDILFVMRNMHVFLETQEVRQAMQNLYFGRKISNDKHRRTIVILSCIMFINPEIAPCVTVVDYTLPDEAELTKVFDEATSSIKIDESRPGAVATYDADHKGRIIQAMRGLTTIEAENVLAYSLRVNRGFNKGLVDTIEDQKATALEESEILVYVPKDKIATMDEIGGYEELKDFIGVRKLAYSPKAKELKIDLPKGIVLVGIPGTAKSLAGKVIARELGQPLVIMNIGAVFGSLVGESERRIRSALNTVDALDGSVVLIDEAEKALGGADQSVGDSGVSRRVFGTILTWLTEKKSRTFVVMTMNRTRGIPPEFLRKGRVDEIFYTDIPDADERDQILKIHCKKRNVDVAQFKQADWGKLVTCTEKFVGAELEQIVCESRFTSFATRQSGQPSIDELLSSASKIIPIAEAEKADLDNIRDMCKGRARPVSRVKQKATTVTHRAVSLV